MDINGFTVVTPKHNKHRRNNKKHSIKHKKQIIEIDEDVKLKDVIEDVQSIKICLENSVYFQNVLDILKTASSSLLLEDIISYGVGSISSCKIAKHQFAFLLAIAEFFKILNDKVKLFDPCFTSIDEEIIREFSFEIIKFNEEGKRPVQSEGTLFYMPHCGRPLYNNLIRSNWSPEKMGKYFIIGNSFQTIVNNTTDKHLSEKYPSIHKVHPFIEEYPLVDSYERKDIFNDTSVHIFSSNKFKQCSDMSSFWDVPRDVEYNDDEEIIKSPNDSCGDLN